MLRRISRALVLPAIMLVSGCLLDSTIDAKGGAVITVKYRLTNESQLEAVKKQMKSADVTVTDASVDKDKMATFNLKTADVTKISTAKFFQNATVKLTDGEKGTKVLDVKWVNKNPSKLPDEMVAYFGKEVTISLTFPGEVVKTNATTSKGNNATWTIPHNDFAAAKETTFNVVYKTS